MSCPASSSQGFSFLFITIMEEKKRIDLTTKCSFTYRDLPMSIGHISKWYRYTGAQSMYLNTQNAYWKWPSFEERTISNGHHLFTNNYNREQRKEKPACIDRWVLSPQFNSEKWSIDNAISLRLFFNRSLFIRRFFVWDLFIDCCSSAKVKRNKTKRSHWCLLIWK